MSGQRKLLTLRRPAGPTSADEIAAPVELLKRAISTRTCVLAMYNRGRVKLAPQVLYSKDDALFTDAVTIERDGRPPHELKLGAFRISGLSGVTPVPEPFVEDVEVTAEDPRYAGGILVRR